jgi:membrane protein YdbS with pleckstrin-like domain
VSGITLGRSGRLRDPRDICHRKIGDRTLYRDDERSAKIDAVESTDARLRPPHQLVSKKAIGYWTLRALGGWLPVIAVQVVWMLKDGGHAGWHVTALIVTGVVGAAHVIVMPQWRFRVHRWEVTPEAVYTQSGWFDQERRIAPISRIQTVDSERGPFEQLFGLANVTVTTASAAGPLKIRALDQEAAERLVDRLTEGTAADRSDAT